MNSKIRGGVRSSWAQQFPQRRPHLDSRGTATLLALLHPKRAPSAREFTVAKFPLLDGQRSSILRSAFADQKASWN